MSTTTDLTTLKINYLTQAQYDTARSQGLINADELYLTPAADSGINDVTVDGVSVVTDNVAEITMPTIPTKVSDLTNDSGYITGYTETDPTVPSWAKASSKPPYTASEVGAVPTSRTINGKALTSDITLSASDVSALPSSTVIPTVNNATLTIQKNGSTVKTFTANASSNVTANITVPTATSDLTNDSGFITGYTETDPTVPSWAKASSKPSYTASEVGAVPTSRTVNGKALSSNITLSASDVSALPSSTVIPTITDTYSGTSSDGMSGKAVKSAIDALDGTVTGTAGSGKTLTAFSQTDGKVSATFGNISITKSQVSDFPTIPSKTSDLTNDSGYITGYTETDPVFSASAAHGITSSDISNWNGKSDFSGSYNDLTDKPTIPTVNNATLTIQKNGVAVNTFTANASSDVTANITVPTKVSDLTNDSGFITGVTSTSTPTASTIAEFDSSAHMNSADMTSSEVSDFVDGLNLVGTGYSRIIPKMSAKVRSASEGSLSLQTSMRLIGCGTPITESNDEFYFTSDGGIRVLKSGITFAIAYADIYSVTSGDSVSIQIATYGSGAWKVESDTMTSNASSTRRSMNVFAVINTTAQDVIYLRARNDTAARGTVSTAKLVVFHLS